MSFVLQPPVTLLSVRLILGPRMPFVAPFRHLTMRLIICCNTMTMKSIKCSNITILITITERSLQARWLYLCLWKKVRVTITASLLLETGTMITIFLLSQHETNFHLLLSSLRKKVRLEAESKTCSTLVRLECITIRFMITLNCHIIMIATMNI